MFNLKYNIVWRKNDFDFTRGIVSGKYQNTFNSGGKHNARVSIRTMGI